MRVCPHTYCNFFLTDSNAATGALCPGCGRSTTLSGRIRLHPQFVRWFLGVLVALLLVLGVLSITAINQSVLAGVSIAVTVAAAVALAAAVRTERPCTHTASLDHWYQQASDELQYWLDRWSELFALAQDSTVEHAFDERLLLDEALAGASEAASDALARCNDYASRFLENAFDRLASLSASNHVEVTHTVAVIERYLETLWLTPEQVAQARHRLALVQPTQRRAQVLQAAGSVTLFSAGPGRVGPDVHDELLRLQTERTLLRESP